MTPKKAYDDQLRHSDKRGIPWLFTYESWLELWLTSGIPWYLRGRKSGQYCMCRYGDTGPYSPRNCFIDLTDNNQQTRWENVRKVTRGNHLDIVNLWLGGDLTQYEIAAMYGVDQSHISKIIKKSKEAYL